MTQHIQQPRASELVREAFDLQGGVPLVVHGDVLPVMVVQDSALGGMPPTTGRAIASGYQAAVAGQYTVARIESPPHTLCRLIRVLLSSSAAIYAVIYPGANIVAPGNVRPRAFIDQRLRGAGRTPSCVLAIGTQVAAVGGVGLNLPVSASPATTTIVDLNWTFGGRSDAYDFVVVSTGGVNQALNVGFEWIETPLP